MANTGESERNKWRGMALVGKYPPRDDMFRLLDDGDKCKELEKGLKEVKESIEWILETCDGEDCWGHLEDTAREIEEILK